MKKYKASIKVSTLLLAVMLLLFVASIFASNIILKREYDRADKGDIYWNYGKILEQPFKHIVIEGGNISGLTGYIEGNIIFEQSKNASVRVLKNWEGYERGSVKASVKNDTLVLHFPDIKAFSKSDYNLRYLTLARISCPDLISIDANNTSMRLPQFVQNNLAIKVSGGSQVEVERLTPGMDSVTVHTKDSSVVKFIMSYKYKGKERMKVGALKADLSGTSLLDLGHADISSLDVNIGDSAAIVLSGDALKRVKK